MKQIIILTTPFEEVELYTTLTKICRDHSEFSYHYLKRQKFPFDYKGYKFEKKPIN